MDFIDYREKLGLGFSDHQKTEYFSTIIFNALFSLSADPQVGRFSYDEYFRFCTITGTLIDSRLSEDYHADQRFCACIEAAYLHREDFRTLLFYIVAFINSCDEDLRKSYIDLLERKLKQAHIGFSLIEDQGEYFVFPDGVSEFNTALVSAPLEWLSSYPQAQKAWIKALKEYANQTDENASDIADKFRKALETFFHEFFEQDRALENMKSVYGTFLKEHGVPSEISNNFETLLLAYTNFMNENAKHHDRTTQNILEYIMYQTGNIIRLLITLKREDTENAD